MTSLVPTTVAYNATLANAGLSNSRSLYNYPAPVNRSLSAPSLRQNQAYQPVYAYTNYTSQAQRPQPVQNAQILKKPQGESKSWAKSAVQATAVYLLGQTLSHVLLGRGLAKPAKGKGSGVLTHIAGIIALTAGLKLANNTRQQLFPSKSDDAKKPGWLSSFLALGGTAAGLAYLLRNYDVVRILNNSKMFASLRDQPFLTQLREALVKLGSKVKNAGEPYKVQPVTFKKSA
jgi:hypothetical protein